MEDPGKAGNTAQRVVVADVAGAQAVVASAGSRGHAQRGESLGMEGVDQVPVAGAPGVDGSLLARLDGQRRGAVGLDDHHDLAGIRLAVLGSARGDELVEPGDPVRVLRQPPPGQRRARAAVRHHVMMALGPVIADESNPHLPSSLRYVRQHQGELPAA